MIVGDVIIIIDLNYKSKCLLDNAVQMVADKQPTDVRSDLVAVSNSDVWLNSFSLSNRAHFNSREFSNKNRSYSGTQCTVPLLKLWSHYWSPLLNNLFLNDPHLLKSANNEQGVVRSQDAFCMAKIFQQMMISSLLHNSELNLVCDECGIHVLTH